MKYLTTFLSLAALCAFSQNSFGYSFTATCKNDASPVVVNKISVNVVSTNTETNAFVFFDGEYRHTLPCRTDSGELVCGVYSGDPTKGGGCMNPYSINEFKMDLNGALTYHYVSSGFAYFDLTSYCEKK